MFEGLSPTHLILILVIAVLILGPGRLPEVGAALGKAMRELRNALEGREEAPALPPMPPSEGESAETEQRDR